MLIKKSGEIPSSEITPRRVYVNRRKFLAGAAMAGGAALIGGRELFNLVSPRSEVMAGAKLGNLVKSQFSTDEKQASYQDATSYNNFYEFGTNKDDPARNAHTLITQPWTVAVEGEVKRPRTFS